MYLGGAYPQECGLSRRNLLDALNPFPCHHKLTLPVRQSAHYAFQPPSIPFSFPAFKALRDAHITQLNAGYESNWQREGIELLRGTGKFVGERELEVLVEGGEKVRVRGKHVCIATGGRPRVPEVEGASEGITSDGFFGLEVLPEKVAVVGAGYIAVEIAGML